MREVPEPEGNPADEYADHQAAALWLTNAKSLGPIAKNTWLRDIARVYRSWTMRGNGVALDRNERIDHPPYEWNNAYFDLLARSTAGLSLAEIDQLALGPLVSLPDESFFDAASDFVRSADSVYFGGEGLDDSAAVGIREKLAGRLMESSGWRWMVRERSASIERHIGSAIAVLFFNHHDFASPAACYLLPKGIDRLPPFLPVLQSLVRGGPSLFVALVTMNLFEVSPRRAHLASIVAATKAWVDCHSDDTQFWVDHGIGRRVCVWIEQVLAQDQSLLTDGDPLRAEVDRFAAALVRLGVAEARRLEQSLART
jgi:hypothetical protein